MDKKRLEELVEEVFGELPEEVLSHADSAVFVVEDWPDAETFASQGLRKRTDLLGLCHGLPLDERRRTGSSCTRSPPSSLPARPASTPKT